MFLESGERREKAWDVGTKRRKAHKIRQRFTDMIRFRWRMRVRMQLKPWVCGEESSFISRSQIVSSHQHRNIWVHLSDSHNTQEPWAQVRCLPCVSASDVITSLRGKLHLDLTSSYIRISAQKIYYLLKPFAPFYWSLQPWVKCCMRGKEQLYLRKFSLGTICQTLLSTACF